MSRGTRAEFQQHTSRGWANVGSSRISSPGMFTLTWLTPHRPTHVTLRVVVTRRDRTVATTATRSVDVNLQPIVVSPSDVVSVPPPGQPGIVVLHAHAPGGGARVARAASDCPTLNPIPQVGQILAVGYSATTPYGSLTKIESVNVLGPCKVTLNTSPATLEEAVGSNGGTLDLARFSEVGAGSASDARAHTAISAGSFHPGLDDAVSCASGAAAALTGSVNLSLTPTLHANFSLLGGLTSAEFTLTGVASATINADVYASTGCTLSKAPLLATPLHIATYAGAIGPIPVVITVQGQLYANASLEGGADGSTGVTANASVTGGVSYRNGQFSPVLVGPTTSFTYSPLTVTADSRDSATVEPALQVLLYGVAGPQLGVSSGLAFNANTTSTPWWTLSVPLTVNAAFVSPTLDLDSKPLTLYSHSFNVAQAPGGFGGGGLFAPSVITVTNPGAQTTPVGTPVSLQVHASDSNGYALTYTASGLPHGLTINPSTGLISGTPEDIGESAVTVTATDTSGASGSTSFAWTISSLPGQSTWTIEQLAKPSGAQSVALSDVSCTATTACMGVGYSETFPEAKPLAEFWNGSTWSVEPVPSPSGERNTLTSVSCTSAISCVAIGGGNGSTTPFSEVWNGATWTMQTTPPPPESQTTSLTSVSCVSSVSCVAVGSYTDELGYSKALAEYWNGSSWALQSAVDPIPAGSPDDDSDSELRSVDCTGPKACVAVGQSENQPEDNWPTLAESWNGTTWTIEPTPPVGTGVYTMELDSVSCSEANACTAVGSYVNGSYSSGGTLAERWNGTEWTVQSSANPPREFSDFGSVSCASATSCLAVGVGGSPDAFYSSFWDGTTWTTEEIPGLGGGGIDAVFCVTPTYCMAVGSTTDLYS